MKKLIIGLLLITTWINCFSRDTVFNDEKIDSVIIQFKSKWRIPGISVAIAKDGRLIYAKGFGFADTLNKIPVTPKSQFRTASCAKTITAIAIIKLVQENRLGLNDKVFGKDGILNGEIYSNIKDSLIYNMTVKNLLQQTIGWPDIDIIGENDASYALNAPIPAGIEENVKYILSQPLDFAPSTAYRYSDFNYLFLGEIISKITQQDYTGYINSEILHPIGAYSTLPAKSTLEEKEENEVVYYDYNGETFPSVFDTSKIVPESYAFNMEPMISSGGWISTPIDMVRLILAVDGLDKPNDILNKESIKLMNTVPENIKSRYAMGMFTNKNFSYHMGQCTWGTSAIWLKTKDNLCFAITCNTLPTVRGSEEEKLDAIINHMKDIFGPFLTILNEFFKYPEIDLFEKY